MPSLYMRCCRYLRGVSGGTRYEELPVNDPNDDAEDGLKGWLENI